MQKNWKFKKSDSHLEKALAKEANLHPIIAKLLGHRGIHESEAARRFLSADMDQLHDPFLFEGMDRTLERIDEAGQKGEKVLVFGDYDVDGVISSVLLTKFLNDRGIDVVNHIPHRMTHGYGLNEEISEFANQENIKLLIAVDCGTTAYGAVEKLNQKGIDVIIIDHHESIDHQLPKAFSIINPKQRKCSYPFDDLASVGLVAKLIQAFQGSLDDHVWELVAIGTIADVAPLRDENRIFVKAGLEKIQKTKNLGLQALLDVSKIRGKQLSPFHVGFILGPRINAAGRMDTAELSLDLFLSRTYQEAFRLAKMLDRHNNQRQKMQKKIVEEAYNLVENEINFKDQKVIVVSKEGWHKGVLGIVASKLVEKYYRPSIIISLEDDVGTASGRSIEGFHLHDALSECAGCLEKFGGHEGAAGLTIQKDKIDPFRDLINRVAEKSLEIKKLTPSILIDSEITLSSINMELASLIASLEPYGEGNPMPIFCSYGLKVKGTVRISGKETLKFWVTDGKNSISAVGFSMAKYKELLDCADRIDIAYQISIDDWNKAPTPQLKLKDIKVGSSSK